MFTKHDLAFLCQKSNRIYKVKYLLPLILLFAIFPNTAKACLELPANPPEMEIEQCVGFNQFTHLRFLDYATYGANTDEYCVCALNIPFQFGQVVAATIVYADTNTPVDGWSFVSDFDSDFGAPGGDWQGFSSDVTEIIPSGIAVDILFIINPFCEFEPSVKTGTSEKAMACCDDNAFNLVNWFQNGNGLLGTDGANPDGSPSGEHTYVGPSGNITVVDPTCEDGIINGDELGFVIIDGELVNCGGDFCPQCIVQFPELSDPCSCASNYIAGVGFEDELTINFIPGESVTLNANNGGFLDVNGVPYPPGLEIQDGSASDLDGLINGEIIFRFYRDELQVADIIVDGVPFVSPSACPVLADCFNDNSFISCPPDQTVSCESDAVAGVVAIDTICSISDFMIDVTGPEISGQANCDGTTYTYRFVVADLCSNIDTCFQTFTIQNDPPIITLCPPPVTVDCIEDYEIGDVEFTTSCGLSADTIIAIPGIASPICPGLQFVVVYDILDECGKSSSCDQLVTIGDGPGVEITFCPPAVTVDCYDEYSPGMIEFETACERDAEVFITVPDILGTICPGDQFDVLYSVQDECGASDDCVQTVRITDGPGLVINACPPVENVTCANEIILGDVDFTTSCDNDATVSVSSPVINGDPNCPGTTYTFTHTITDGCGNIETCEQLFIIVSPAEPIILDCPADEMVSCESDIVTGTPEFTTSCGVSATVIKTGPVVEGDPHCDGTTYTYTFTVTDACGRMASCDQVFTIDNTCKRMDFCAFAPATIITDQYPGVTISTQDNHNRPAMIFDTGNPTGNDFDLGTPNQIYGGPGVGPGFGNDSFQCNALIISKDRHIPNETEGQLIFDFDCAVIIRTIDFIDMECGHNTVTLYDRDHHVIDQITLPQYGENSFHVEDIYQGGVYKMVVDFPCAGGAISDIKYCEDMTPGAMCGACESSTLDFQEHGIDWHLNAMAGNYDVGYQSYDINIADPDGIFEDSHEDLSGIEIGINPHDVDDELIITYDLSEVAGFVQFDIEDLDFKDGVSKQREQVCICGFLEGDPNPIYPSIISLDGHVDISNNCAIASADSNVSHADESVLVTFTECIDQVVIKYGTGPNSPTHDPTYSKMIIGKRVGFNSETCPDDCTDCGLFGDIDEDGICDDCDICLSGDDNMDSDGDGIPDACDGDCEDSALEGDDDLDGVCNIDDVCPGGNDNIDVDGNGVPDACEECDEYKLVFGCTNEWQVNAVSGTYTVLVQEFDINIMDMDNILEDSNQEGFGLNVGIEPHDTDDVVLIKYNLSQVANNVMFDIVDLDYKDGNSKQQEAVCVYGFLDTIPTMIFPVISSLDGSVSINGNCAEGTVNSSHSGQDESIMVVFDECVDQIVIEYGTGTNSPTHNPDYSNITIGLDMGFKTEVCEHLCLPACQDSMMLVGMATDEHFEVSDMIQSHQRILGPNVKYDAGKNILLGEGFEIMDGALFEAFIDGCDNN